jgi:predicted TPR repeat methyltransferase
MKTTAEKLADARDAYDALMTGRMARVVVDQNGERVEYAAANSGKLAAYIGTLEDALLGTVRSFRPLPPAGVIW